MNKARGAGEVFIEFVVNGNVVKVTAIDSATGLEASIVGPAGGAREALTQAAVKKLKYLLKKRR
jgi:hypothetical protein